MSDDEETYPAGEDVPGTPASFPFGLVSFGFACFSAMLAALWLFVGFGPSVILPLAAGAGWLGCGLFGLAHDAWKGFAAGLIVVLAPWILSILLVGAALP